VHAHFALFRSRDEEAIELGCAALGRLREQDAPLRAWILSTLSVAHLIRGDRGSARRATNEALALAESTGMDLLTPLLYTGWQHVQVGNLTAAIQTYHRALLAATPEGEAPLPGMDAIHSPLSVNRPSQV